MRRWIPLWFAALCWGAAFGAPFISAGDSSATPPTSAATSPNDGEEKGDGIASAQLGLAMRYQRFENTMLQVAEYLRKTDPERADLLIRAIGKSKETRLPDQFEHLVNLLKQDQLGDAVQEQEHVVVLLEGILDLLQSEDRRDELEKEKQRLKDLIKDVDRLIDRQTDLRTQTERKDNPQGLEQSQKKLADDAQRLVDKIDGQDSARNSAPSEGAKSGSPQAKPNSGKEDPGADEPNEKQDHAGKSDGESPPAEKQGEEKSPKPSDDAKPSDANDPAKSKDPQSKPDSKSEEDGASDKGEKPMSEGQSGQKKPKSGKPSPSQPGQPMPPQEGQPGEQSEQNQEKQGSEQQPSSDQRETPGKSGKTPGRDEIERAKDEMERAIEELKKKNHGKASDEQDRALSELIKAKDKLEEILRQLREEEREMMLAALEARFRDMLARQLVVYNGTVGLSTVAEAQQNDRQRNQAVALARAEEGIALLAAKALTVLKEEGSSIAFPEAVEEMRDDMLTVVQRLERFDVAELTQSIERDIMEALEELIEALQKEMEKAKNKDQQQQPPGNGEPPDPALVDQLAELKTLRALQFRVNRRTKILGREVEGEQARDPDLLKQLHQLAKRQEKIQRATYDLSTGRNR